MTMKMKQGFAYPDGRRVAVFDNLGITRDSVKTAYPRLLDLAHEHGLEARHYEHTHHVGFIDGTRIVLDVNYGLADEIIYDPGFFRVANHATKILTGNSLLSAIRQYITEKRRMTM